MLWLDSNSLVQQWLSRSLHWLFLLSSQKNLFLRIKIYWNIIQILCQERIHKADIERWLLYRDKSHRIYSLLDFTRPLYANRLSPIWFQWYQRIKQECNWLVSNLHSSIYWWCLCNRGVRGGPLIFHLMKRCTPLSC